MGRALVRALTLFAVGALSAGFAAPAAALAEGPAVGQAFEYTFHRHVGNGDGEYYEYSDDLYSNGRYEFIGLNDTHGTVHNHYDWRYSSTEGRRENGAVDRVTSYSLPQRRYTGPLTDDDDYDDVNASSLSIWFWISPTVRVGDRVDILDSTYEVVSRDSAAWVTGWPQTAIELRGSGSSGRNDDYGQFRYTWTDSYFFDPATGLFLQERYVEKDTGTWQGNYATFTWTEDVDYTAGTYHPTINAVAMVWLVLIIAFVMLLLAGMVVGARRIPIPVEMEGLGTAKVRQLRRLKDLPTDADRFFENSSTVQAANAASDNMLSQNFHGFIDDFANKALLAGDKVYYATNRRGLVGLAFYNKEADIGTIMAKDTGLAETLRKKVGALDFFTEWRHTVPRSAIQGAMDMGMSIPGGDAYNLFDTYSVLRLDGVTPANYDTTLVAAMKREDLPAVAAVARTVFKVDSLKWLTAQLDSGDAGFVARLDGKVVGFAFATFADGAGRLHSLAVLPEYRNRGIGRELVRARLNALAALGATFVISEVAQWNLASLQLAVSHGFKPVGEMYVETARKQRVKRDIIRR